jgi:biopolymer transport protein ExbB/TolQ
MEATNAAVGISIIDLIHQGWYATYPLILFSVIVTSIVIERVWLLSRLGGAIDSLTLAVCSALEKGDLNAASSLINERMKVSPAARVYGALMPMIRKADVEEILECGERRRLEEARLMKRNVWVLGTVAASAPFIGLFGTVIGIIKSFHQMATMGTGGFAVVAAGISEALVATAMGLLVAILALLTFNYLQVKIAHLDTLLRVGLGRVIESAALGGVHGPR